MTTAARTQSRSDSRWYDRDGQPQYEVIGSSTGRPRPVTIADARKNGWLPSVTTILKCLAKPALEDWKNEMACLAVLTTPRHDGEAIDAFVHRVLHVEKQQDEVAKQARDLGTDIHAAIELALHDKPYNRELSVYVKPAVREIQISGQIIATEKIVVGDRYAGKLDALTHANALITLWDTKTAKTLPKTDSWWDHQCQTASYAKAFGNTSDIRIQTANLYVSTTNPGEIKVCVQQDWQRAWQAFRALVSYWYLANDYRP